MKATIAKQPLVDILSKIQGITNRKSSLAITSCVLIQARGNELILSATDLETGFEGHYPAEIELEGAVALNSKKLYEIIKDFPSETISMHEVENHWIDISNPRVQYHLVGMDPEEFPAIPKLERASLVEIEASTMRRMIEQTVVIASAPDERRAHFSGVYAEVVGDTKPSQLRMVSTDGSRLHCAEGELHPAAALDWPASLIPKKGLTEVNRFLPEDGTILVGIKDNHFVMRKPSESVVIRLLEGGFPKYDELISERAEGHNLSLDKRTFQMMLRRMSILSSENYRGVFFKFSDGALTITSTNPDIGDAKEELEIGFSGDEIEAAFNPRFFTDALGVIKEDTVMLHIIDAEKPCLMRGDGNLQYRCVIMPMRL
jgi:DNA polymerase-3 subunit beta